jgi:hypothetical protein
MYIYIYNYNADDTNVDEGLILDGHEGEKNIIENKLISIKLLMKAYVYSVGWMKHNNYNADDTNVDKGLILDGHEGEKNSIEDKLTLTKLITKAYLYPVWWMKHNNQHEDDTDAQHEELQRMQKTMLTLKTEDEKEVLVKTNSEEMVTDVDKGLILDGHEGEKNIIENKLILIKLLMKAYLYPVWWMKHNNYNADDTNVDKGLILGGHEGEKNIIEDKLT